VTVDKSIVQYYEPDPSEAYRYAPYLAAEIEVGFHNTTKGIDLKREILSQLYLADLEHLDWDECDRGVEVFENLPDRAPTGAQFLPLPQIVSDDKGLRKATRSLRDHIYTTERLDMFRCRSPRLESKPKETLDQFRLRLQDVLAEKKEEALDELKEKYGKKEERLLSRLARAQDKIEKEKADSNSSLVDVGISVLGALFGRKSVTSIGRAFNKGSRAYKERGQLSRAQEYFQEVQEQISDLEIELEDKIDELSDQYAMENHPIETFAIKPKKSDISIENIAIVWRVD
jgi:hypothetical protein